MTPSSLEGPPGGGGGAVFVLLDDHPDNGLLQQASPHVGEVHLQLGGDEGEANVEVRVPLEAGPAEAHPAVEAGPAVAEEVALPGAKSACEYDSYMKFDMIACRG